MNRLPVTAHAVLRWLERIEGEDIEGVRRILRAKGRPDDDGTVVKVLAAYGLDIGEIKRRILPDGYLAAVQLGARCIRTGHAKLVIVDGKVVSVMGMGQRVTPRSAGLGRAAIRESA
jgi:hypothetical protein